MEKGRWNHGICQCSGTGLGWWHCCVIGCLCTQCQVLKLHSHVLGESPPRACSPLPCALCALSFPWPLTPFFQHCYVRARIRDQLRVPESCCETCLIATFLGGSSALQMAATLVNQRSVPAMLFMDDDADLHPLLTDEEKNLSL